MRFIKLHESPDTILVTPQYKRHYEIKLKEWYPELDVVDSLEVSHGHAYLVSKDELIKEYKKKINEDQNTAI